MLVVATVGMTFGAGISRAETDSYLETARPGFTEYNGVKVAYYEFGPAADKAPTVLYTGGWPWGSDVLEPGVKELTHRYHVVRYDTRGAGASDHPTEQSAYTLENLAGEFNAVVDAVAPGRKVHAFGEGLAAFTIGEYAHEFPGRLLSISTFGAPSLDMAVNAMRRDAQDPSTYPRLAVQIAALSYVGILGTPNIPEMAFATGIPTIAVNAFTDIISDRLNDLFTTNLGNEPTNAYDSAAGLNRYSAAFLPGLLGPTHYDYLDVPEVSVIQLSGDFIESDILIDGLETRTPHLVLRYTTGNHFPPNYQLVREAVDQAIADTEPNP
ncbi:alpha/beta fold hydrolase [Nocardia sp. CA-128927]|uniref:alpha/beta fold hydrolase n=1 Tax=Nocardia sp. CA-128927 TaxID=3239975 RepID=UPI003D99558D